MDSGSRYIDRAVGSLTTVSSFRTTGSDRHIHTRSNRADHNIVPLAQTSHIPAHRRSPNDKLLHRASLATVGNPLHRRRVSVRGCRRVQSSSFPVLPLLKELVIESMIWTEVTQARLLELLRRANRIKSLTLHGLVRFSSGFSLRNDLIPELETFRGPADSVLTFCKGRPVRDLFTWFGDAWEMTDDIPNLIRPGLVPLEHLHISLISWKEDTIGYIARHCPQLVSFFARQPSFLTKDRGLRMAVTVT